MKLLLIMCLMAFSSQAQDIESIKSSDTIYVLFKRKDASHYKNIKIIEAGNEFVDIYILTANSTGKRIHINAPNDKNTEIKKNILIVKRKKFMAQNKDKIIDMNFIDKQGLGEVFLKMLEVQSRKKKIFILTEDALKKRKLVLQKAAIGYSDFIEM